MTIVMKEHYMEDFGKIVQSHRRQKNWAVRTFIDLLGEDLSPAYITKIEIHGEIPSPQLICKIAEVLGLDQQDLLAKAKEEKVKSFGALLDKKYQTAISLYRLQKEK
ncbi:MAG: helix-turn-helix domain-containing protein [Candidatus Dependentiae bacterium]|nr:helix-turn-helix domain-containing protein [Candidatus Dependentiae bacterium]